MSPNICSREARKHQAGQPRQGLLSRFPVPCGCCDEKLSGLVGIDSRASQTRKARIVARAAASCFATLRRGASGTAAVSGILDLDRSSWCLGTRAGGYEMEPLVRCGGRRIPSLW